VKDQVSISKAWTAERLRHNMIKEFNVDSESRVWSLVSLI